MNLGKETSLVELGKLIEDFTIQRKVLNKQKKEAQAKVVTVAHASMRSEEEVKTSYTPFLCNSFLTSVCTKPLLKLLKPSNVRPVVKN